MSGNSCNASTIAGQEPRLRTVNPSAIESDGDLATKLASDYGLTPDPWQRLVLDDWLARAEGTDHEGNPRRQWAHLTCGLSLPRQSGKNAVLEMRELFGAVGLGEKILHTAHEVKTAQRHFRRLQHFFGRKANDPKAQYPELNRLVSEIRRTNGQEAVFLENGGSIELIARSTGSGRGFTVDVVVCDEAQSMSDEDLEALLSTTSAGPMGDPQWLYTGTPPGPKVNGEVFTRVRQDALGSDPWRIAWHEWSPPEGYDLDDHDVYRTTNPGLITGRLLWDVVIGERKRFSDAGFARERLGDWLFANAAAVISPEAWAAAADPESQITGDLAFGIEMNDTHDAVSIGAAGRRADGRVHLEYIEGTAEHLSDKEPGMGWIVPVCQALNRQKPRGFVIDQSSPAGYLIQPLRDAGLTVITVAQQGHAQACGRLYELIKAQQAVHVDQPPLSYALSVARKRVLSEGAWLWHRKAAESDITPIVAVTLALFGLDVPMKVEKPRTNRAFFL